MKARYVFEAINFQRGLDPHAALGIGSEKLRDQSKLKRFAEENGFTYGISKKGTPYVYIPVDYEENLGYKGYLPLDQRPAGVRGGYQYEWIKGMEYTITYPEGWDTDGIPISLRKRWINGKGKSVKQALIGRFPDLVAAMNRIKKQAAAEMKKSGPAKK